MHGDQRVHLNMEGPNHVRSSLSSHLQLSGLRGSYIYTSGTRCDIKRKENLEMNCRDRRARDQWTAPFPAHLF